MAIETDEPALADDTALSIDKLTYTGVANQFAGGFSPRNAPYGGFGGGACTAVKTPIIFIHDYGSLWGSIRKFIAIAGGLRGLSSCYWAGYANSAITTCGSQNVFDSNIFGFFPHLAPGYNPRMGDDPTGASTTWAAATRTASVTSGRRTTPA